MSDDVKSLDDLARSDAEVKLLACIVKGSAPPRYSVYSEIRTEITEAAFLDEGMKSVFKSIDSVVGAGEHLNPHTLTGRLSRDTGSREALAAVLSYARTDHADENNVPQYLRHMKESHVPTKLRDVLSTSIAMIEDGVPVHDVHSRLDHMVDEIVRSDRPAEADFIMVRAATHVALEELRVVWGGDENSRPFIPTPWLTTNSLLGGGIYKRHLNLVAARPSVGKTAVWEQMAMSMAAAEQGVIVLSTEMSMSEHLIRCGIRESNICTSYQELMSHKFPEIRDTKSGRLKIDMLNESMEAMVDLPIIGIQQTREVTETVRRVYRAIRSWPDDWPPPKVFILDYIQQIRGRGLGAWSRTDEIFQITNVLRELCIAEDMAFVPLAQLNRGAEEREKDGSLKRPRFKDIKDCGTLEQDAWNIIFPHRDIMTEASDAGRQEAEFVLGKARSGSPGIVSMFWEGPRIRYLEKGSAWWGNAMPNPDESTPL